MVKVQEDLQASQEKVSFFKKKITVVWEIYNLLLILFRYCTVPQICGSNVLKEERNCSGRKRRRRKGRKGRRKGRKNQGGNKCRRRRRKVVPSVSVNGGGITSVTVGGEKKTFHIVQRLKMSQRTRGMLRVNQGFYTKWSKWSPCSEDCRATRSRSCRFNAMCGNSVVHEAAYCYNDGSLCHELHLKNRSLGEIHRYRKGLDLDAETGGENDLHHSSSATPAPPPAVGGRKGYWNDGRRRESNDSRARGRLTSEYPKCGVRYFNNSGDSSPYSAPPHSPLRSPYSALKSSALRIIGGRESAPDHWPWQAAILNQYREVFCGGTLLAPGWILTAAHCVRKQLSVRLGEHDLVVNEVSLEKQTDHSQVYFF